MQKITPYLWFDNNLEEAVKHYTSIFKNAKVINISNHGGNVMSATFELEGQKFMGLAGGPHFKFTPAVSFFVHCESQEEVDYYWDKLLEGGSEDRCGWLKDKFGLSWQIIPAALGKYLTDKDPVKAQRVAQAMMAMNKIDVKKLEEAYKG